jgi:hypothetical protein
LDIDALAGVALYHARVSVALLDGDLRGIMTLNDIQRAHLALFAAREAGASGCFDQMKAIALCIRNRVRQGWYDGDWIDVIEHADEVAGNPPGPRVYIDLRNRDFQILIREIDEIFFGRQDWDKYPSRLPMPGMEESIGKATYWAFINQPYTPWFRENVLSCPKDHAPKANMGLIMFYE